MAKKKTTKTPDLLDLMAEVLTLGRQLDGAQSPPLHPLEIITGELTDGDDANPAGTFFEASGQNWPIERLVQALDPKVGESEKAFSAAWQALRDRIEALDGISDEEKQELTKLLMEVEDAQGKTVYAHVDALFNGVVTTIGRRLAPWLFSQDAK